MYEELYLKSPNKDIITLYIRPETSKMKVLDLLNKEEPIIDNIKSRVTRQGIQKSFLNLRSALLSLKRSKNGYILCVSPEKVVIIDNILITSDKYFCGGEFYSNPLEEAIQRSLNPIGILIIETKEATLGYISERIHILKNMTSGIAGKHNKGGQSQARFQRDREEKIKHFFTRIGKESEIFLDAYPITELIISGSGKTKNKFLSGSYLYYRLKPLHTLTLDTQYTGEYGIKETLYKALPLIQKNAFAKEVKEVEDFFEILGKEFNRIIYGKEEIEKNLYSLNKIIQIEEITKDYSPIENIVLHFKGEHYEKIKGLGGIVGIK